MTTPSSRRIFESALERVRYNFHLRVYGYVVMPDHVHLLLSEPQYGTLADALKSLKQGVSRQLIGGAEHFWQKRYYDFNVRNYAQFVEMSATSIATPFAPDCAPAPRIGNGAPSATTPQAVKGV